ncbi:MAG: histidine kinase, partial [Zetaproteobacteria bacterium CG_4_8_14_3_um_filter_59_5]
IMNLLINASDAIGERNGDITISTGLTEADANELRSAHAADDVQPGEFVYLEVTDNGSGMDKSVQEKLFDPFFTTKFTGRGLGMSAVLGIVRGHHGAIRLISEPGKGSTFRVLLPASAGDGEAETAPAAAESLSPACGMVLIVDDELPVRETARLMLEDFGFTTMTAADGVEGVAAYREHQAEIVAVLLDMTMPNMDGRTCFAELKRINPDVKVLLSSGYNEQETTTRFTGQGLSGFLQKPYTPEALRSKIREVLDS